MRMYPLRIKKASSTNLISKLQSEMQIFIPLKSKITYSMLKILP